MAVLSEFSPLFFEGQATASNVPSEFPCAIAGHPYIFEPKHYKRAFIAQRRDTQDETTEPGEQTLSPEGLWRRSQSDWSLGAGQRWLDEEESVRRRFRVSLGVDVWGDREVSLLPATEEKRNSSNTNLRILRAGTRLYVVDGATLIFSDGTSSEQNATWVTGWTTATGLPVSSILDIATSGSHVYVLGGDNSIYRATIGTTAFTLFYNPTAVVTRIWAALGRLIASDGRTLYEITATPSETTILQHPDPNMVWSAVVGTPTGFHAGGNIGENGEVRHWVVRDDGAAFTVPVVSAQFRNEKVNELATAGAAIIAGTSEGFRFAVLNADAAGLEFGPVVAVGDVRCLTVDTADTDQGPETFIWFGWTNIVGGSSGLGRIRPSRFTEGTSVVAYASDVFTASSSTTIAVASLGDRRYFALSADGFFGATANKVTSGTLTTGRLRYGLLDSKVYTGLQWQTAPLAGSVVADMEFDTGNTIEVGAQTAVGTVASDKLNIGPVTAEWAEITFTLERSTIDTTTGPKLRWWLLNAIPAAQTTERILLPVRLQRKVTHPRSGRVSQWVPNEELDFLRALVKSQQIVSFQLGNAQDDVYITNVEEGSVEEENQWNDIDHVIECISLVEMQTLR